MIISLTGASGFIGSAIRQQLNDICEEFLILDRNDSLQTWSSYIEKSDVIINLAGYSVFNRWNKKNREKIFNSRILTTRKIVSILNKMPPEMAPKLFISTSATGIYPDDPSSIYFEHSMDKGNSFLSEVVEKWESEAKDLANPEVRLIIMRLGVVLGRNSKMIKSIRSIFKMGIGGIIGNGKQMMSFIHIDDLINAVRFFIQNKEMSGVYNLVSPQPVTNYHFTKAFGRALKRPTFMVVPAFMMKLMYGEASRITVKGATVYPDHLVKQGFVYKYPTIEETLNEICS